MPLMPKGRVRSAAATGIDGKIYLFCDSSAAQVTTVDAFDPVANTWTRLDAGLPYVTWGCAAASVGSLIYVATGQTLGNGGVPIGGLYSFDPIAGQLTSLGLEPLPRSAAAMLGGADGRVYLLGGYAPTGAATADVQIYEPATNTWDAGTPLPFVSEQLAGAVDSSGFFYALGGEFSTTGPELSAVASYDPTTQSWDAGPLIPNLLSGLTGLGAARGSDGFVYAMGGEPDAGVASYVDAQRFQPGQDAGWVALPNMPHPRYVVSVAADQSGGRNYVFGGIEVSDGGPTPTAKLDAWDVDAGKWIPSP